MCLANLFELGIHIDVHYDGKCLVKPFWMCQHNLSYTQTCTKRKYAVSLTSSSPVNLLFLLSINLFELSVHISLDTFGPSSQDIHLD